MATGASKETSVKNIYDMAGNMWEWTTETGNLNEESKLRAVLRGGSFFNNGSSDSISYRSGSGNTVSVGANVGFRVVLYIQ